jgi:hypothetical protein
MSAGCAFEDLVDCARHPREGIDEAGAACDHRHAIARTLAQEQKVIRAKVGLLELAKQLGSVSQACKVQLMGSMLPTVASRRSQTWRPCWCWVASPFEPSAPRLVWSPYRRCRWNICGLLHFDWARAESMIGKGPTWCTQPAPTRGKLVCAE